MQDSSEKSKGNKRRKKKETDWNLEPSVVPRPLFKLSLGIWSPTLLAEKPSQEPWDLGNTEGTGLAGHDNLLIRLIDKQHVVRVDKLRKQELSTCKQNLGSPNYHWLSVAVWIKTTYVILGHPILSSQPSTPAPVPLSSLAHGKLGLLWIPHHREERENVCPDWIFHFIPKPMLKYW